VAKMMVEIVCYGTKHSYDDRRMMNGTDIKAIKPEK
jgi:hypothetical protein